LGLNIEEGKKPEEIKEAIKGEIKKMKDDAEKGKEYQKLVDEKTNAPIVDQNKIDQGKLTAILEELNQLHDVANHKDNERILDNGKFSQAKLDEELAKGKTAGEDIKNAAAKLGVGDLKDATLEAKLGNKKLSDIPAPETLESILEKNKKLEDIVKGVGIDPNNAAEVEKKIKKWKGLEERVKEFFGENYEERLEVQEYQANIEVNTNKN